ncbi:MAG: SMC-Scp complex subunit ScpB [Bacteroidota bacterium]
MSFLENHIEALIFCAKEPIRFDEIKACLSEMLDADIPDDDIRQALDHLLDKFDQDHFSFKIYEIAEGFQFLSKPDFHASITVLLKHKSKKQLSKSALEVLAIIAYRQPVTKGDIEKIRGVGSDYALQKLLDKELAIILGKADSPGRPLLYGVGDKFMEYFGLNSLKDLPQPQDFAEKESPITNAELNGSDEGMGEENAEENEG